MNRSSTQRALFVGLLVASSAIALTSLVGCKRGKDGAGGNPTTIVVDGSDTMVNLCQAWAETYTKSNPSIKIQVSGGGSGVGINHLIDGTIDMATSSRKMTEPEIKRFKEKHTGKEPKEHIVGARRAGDLRPHEQPVRLDLDRGVGGDLRGWREDQQVVADGQEAWGVPERRHHAGEPAEQFRDLRVLPRARAGQGAGLQGRVDRPERIEGRGGAGRARRRARSGTAAWGTGRAR